MERSTTVATRILVLAAGTALLLGCGPNTDGARQPIGALDLIPQPMSVSGELGFLELTPRSRIVASAETRAVGELLGQALRRSTGFAWEVTTAASQRADIVLRIDADLVRLGPEGYALVVDDRQALIRAPTAAGIFYGTQTLRQLLPPEVEGSSVAPEVEWKVPMVQIEDRPRFAWRGVMLDVARHFFGPGDVKALIEVLASYKINRFHIHFTDDQGWRIEIESWPNLTAIGSTIDIDGGPGGFYTQAELTDIVAYADARFVTVVPEIDMPGHTNAALASYGELNESGMPTELTPTVPFGSSSLWTDGPDTLRFVDDVIGEVAALTTGPYVHVGGDEALSTSDEAYATFMTAVQEIVTRHGKTMVGWEEMGSVGNVGLTPPFIAQYWLDERRAAAARDRGALLIASPAPRAYLDMKYDAETPIGLSWAGFTDVEDAYDWDPVTDELAEADFLGVEAPLWTETVRTRDDIDLLMFPRALGHAEIGWSPRDGRDWEEYRARLAAHGARLEARRVSFYRSPLVEWAAP